MYTWLDQSQSKIELLERSSIFALPSYNEGLPVSILEAMAAGLPVISTNIGGIPEQIDHKASGFIIKPGDTESLLNHIKFLLENEDARKQLGEAAKYKVDKSFSLNVIGDEILNMYAVLTSDS